MKVDDIEANIAGCWTTLSIKKLTDKYVVLFDGCRKKDCDSNDYPSRLEFTIWFDLEDDDDLQMREIFRTILKEDPHASVGIHYDLSTDVGIMKKVKTVKKQRRYPDGGDR